MADKAFKFVGMKCNNFQFNYEKAGAKHSSGSFWLRKF